ncbi:MAG: peptidoglycan DD-metalloendopeptidase family protein [Deltaproteobacteria bacterium]|nr:peptidoglycan DD-metalloendopeptidase family protein [Deltaproteobacteria bacterium]
MRRTLIPLFILILGVASLFWMQTSVKEKVPSVLPRVEESAQGPLPEPVPEFTVDTLQIPRNSSFYDTLASKNIAPLTVLNIIAAAKSEFDLAKISFGTPIALHWSGDNLHSVKVSFSLEHELAITRQGNDIWMAQSIDHPVSIETIAFTGIIKSSLWDSARGEGMSPELIDQLAGILGWQIDFSRELHPDDEWALLVEKRIVQGQDAGFGVIQVAEVKRRDEDLLAIRFETADHVDYYDWEGKNLRGKFLKTPLKYSRISSRFSQQRFHPILKINRPHRGVDYAAAEGTPVYAVGDGRVLQFGRNGGAGNMIKLRHNAHFMTAYKHLSGFAKGLHLGKKVNQGDVIGYVGQTGLASAPHLHFEFYENGIFKDPLGKRFPREKPVDVKDQDRFMIEAKRLYAQLNGHKERIRLASPQEPAIML